MSAPWSRRVSNNRSSRIQISRLTARNIRPLIITYGGWNSSSLQGSLARAPTFEQNWISLEWVGRGEYLFNVLLYLGQPKGFGDVVSPTRSSVHAGLLSFQVSSQSLYRKGFWKRLRVTNLSTMNSWKPATSTLSTLMSKNISMQLEHRCMKYKTGSTCLLVQTSTSSFLYAFRWYIKICNMFHGCPTMGTTFWGSYTWLSEKQ